MITFKEVLCRICIYIGLMVGLGISSGIAWALEMPITIVGQGAHRYYKPETGFAPGDVYITYRDEDMAVSFNRLANQLSWTDNSKNAAAGYPNITSCEIWRAPISSVMSDNAYSLLTEVDSSIKSFLDYQGSEANVQYVYSLRSVDNQGYKSPFNNL